MKVSDFTHGRGETLEFNGPQSLRTFVTIRVELTAEITDLSNLSDPSDGDAEFPGPRPLMGATVPPTAPAEAKSNGRAPPLGPPGDSLDDPMAVIVPGASVGIDILLRTSMEGRLDLRRRSYA
jgi:hypothetical protein